MIKKMLSREQIIDTLKKMPEQVTLDDVLDSIILLEKIERGLEQSINGQITSDEQLEEKLPEWLR